MHCVVRENCSWSIVLIVVALFCRSTKVHQSRCGIRMNIRNGWEKKNETHGAIILPNNRFTNISPKTKNEKKMLKSTTEMKRKFRHQFESLCFCCSFRCSCNALRFAEGLRFQNGQHSYINEFCSSDFSLPFALHKQKYDSIYIRREINDATKWNATKIMSKFGKNRNNFNRKTRNIHNLNITTEWSSFFFVEINFPWEFPFTHWTNEWNSLTRRQLRCVFQDRHAISTKKKVFFREY